MRIALVCVAALAACLNAAATARPADATNSWQSVTIQASDSTSLSCVYLIPTGSMPSGGWPGVILFHGLGSEAADMEQLGTALTNSGFAGLACDARGTGNSGGKFGLDGPTENQDAQDIFNWFTARPDISDTQIGGLGISLGGGAVLNAAVAGVPFKAIVPVITWTNLATDLNPNGVPKTGLLELLTQAVPAQNWDPAVAQAAQSLLAGNVTPQAKSVEAARSSIAKLHSLTVPTFMIQGRHDFLDDINQVTTAWKQLAGPKELYLGDVGHAPSKNPPAEVPVYVADAALWFKHFLIDGGGAVPPTVILAHDPWPKTGKPTTVFNTLPQTRSASLSFPGGGKLSGGNSAEGGEARLTGGPHETFGGGVVRVRYSGAKDWTHLVATVSIRGKGAPITEGAARITSSSGVVKIPLMNEAVLVPRGAWIEVFLSSTSNDNVNGAGIPIYASPAPKGASITIKSATLKLSFLKHPVSQ